MNSKQEERLSTLDQWDASYRQEVPDGKKIGFKQVLKRCLGPRFLSLLGDYDQWLLWNVLYSEHLPKGNHLKILEIGSAPGKHLIELHKRFGFDPYGVEYTPAGVAVNRAEFEANGIDPDQVIEADVFSESFLQKYAGQFDIVISRGFIEHFKDPMSVVGVHLKLLKSKGTLVIEVPNFRGMYYPWYLLFRRSVLTWHNFETMKESFFKSLFQRDELVPKYSGSFGTVSFNMYMPPQNRFSLPVKVARSVFQIPTNILLHLFFKKGGPECALTSPHRLYIGEKRAVAA